MSGSRRDHRASDRHTTGRADEATRRGDRRTSPSPARGRHPSGRRFAQYRARTTIRVGTVVATLVLVWVAVAVLRREVLSPAMPFDAWRAMESTLAGILGVSVVVLACRLLDRRRIESLGFGRSRVDVCAFFVGVGLWVGLSGIGLIASALLGWTSTAIVPPTWSFVGWLLFQGVLVFVFEALPEELAFRGYVYTNLEERLPRWLAVMGQAVLFLAWAFAVVGVQRALGISTGWSPDLDRGILFLTFGLTLALLRIWIGSLWASIGFHWAFQTMMQLLYLDRLTVLRIPSDRLPTAAVVLWFFGIVVGGLVAWSGVVAKSRAWMAQGPGTEAPS